MLHAVLMSNPRQVTDADMPQLFQAADRASLDAQSAYVNGTRLRLACLVLAAASGLTSWRIGAGKVDVLAVASLVFFIGAIIVEGALWKSRPNKTWYDARAVAESAKTLAWKFAVCADPFPVAMPLPDAQRSLLEKLDVVQAQFSSLDLAPIEAKAVSEWMREQRTQSWTDRREVYLEQRLQSQRAWYARKAKYNKSRSNRWRGTLIALEFIGAMCAFGEVFNDNFESLAPLVAVVVGSIVAWVETKQHDYNGRAYAAAVADLSKAESKLEVSSDEDTWALEANDAEDAISREHTLWLASRSQN